MKRDACELATYGLSRLLLWGGGLQEASHVAGLLRGSLSKCAERPSQLMVTLQR